MQSFCWYGVSLRRTGDDGTDVQGMTGQTYREWRDWRTGDDGTDVQGMTGPTYRGWRDPYICDTSTEDRRQHLAYKKEPRRRWYIETFDLCCLHVRGVGNMVRMRVANMVRMRVANMVRMRVANKVRLRVANQTHRLICPLGISLLHQRRLHFQ
jgi:hypothetical protein